MADALPLSNRLARIRNLSGLIDISKSTLQLDIILALNANNELSPAEIASVIGQRRKAVTDALRKLRNKGLVDTTLEGGKSARYVLTDLGIELVKTLLSILEVSPSDEPGRIGETGAVGIGQAFSGSEPAGLKESSDGRSQSILHGRSFQEAGRTNGPQNFTRRIEPGSFALASALSQLLFALGTAKGNALPLSEIASIMGLSEQRTESYLELFMKSEPRLFRRYTDDPSWVKHLRKLGLKLRTKKRETFYGLTQEGLQYFYKLPSYNRIRRSKSYKMLSTLTRSNSPREIVKKLLLILLISELFSLIGMVVPLDLRITSFWLAFTILLGSVALASALIYRIANHL
ncbi:MAG: winged helix-turn-helix transcriptional regulator [Candidatus Methanosuratus sp.]|nr:winged helix-turn-helix transcriptional regulator [Candidatus Methanosuratincola sp.]